ncbi:hypothetical protein ABW21_db0208073 [Orbilia brochopaga]|nr:hypothetical protein ABW21_db0208073 [Drechslerella brochopaga]
MQLTAILTAVVMAVPAVLGAAVPNPPGGVPYIGPPQHGGHGGPGGPGGPGFPGFPDRPQPRPKHCIQEWFGTAPLCKGRCPGGWDTVLYADRAGSCQQSNPFKIVESCSNLSSHKCTFGTRKALCERCFDHYGH